MNWKTPITWVTGKLVRADQLNRELRDLASYLKNRLLPIGIIQEWGSDTPPDGWLLCDGSAISRSTYASLFNVIGITHGVGNGSTTFNLPNVAGLFPIHRSSSRPLATTGGAAEKTLISSNMPSHRHVFGEHEHNITTVQVPVTFFGAVEMNSPVFPENALSGFVNTTAASGTPTGATGSGDSFDIMQSWLAVNYVIKVQ